MSQTASGVCAGVPGGLCRRPPEPPGRGVALRAKAALPAVLALAGLACLRGGTEPRRALAADVMEPVVLAPTAVAADGTLTIAAVFPTIGRYAASGLQSLQGARLAVEERNRAGGVNGRRLRLLEYRTGSYFVDVTAVRAAIEEALPDGPGMLEKYGSEVKPFLAPFDAMLASGTFKDDLGRSTVIISVK